VAASARPNQLYVASLVTAEATVRAVKSWTRGRPLRAASLSLSLGRRPRHADQFVAVGIA
jgi:hypothetical protein